MSGKSTQICFATNNEHKLVEVRSLLQPDFRVVSLQEVGCKEELPEEKETLEDNSLQKAQYVFDHYNISCFADDTGLEVESLNGQPGVYSARYAGQQRSSDDNINLLLRNLEGKSSRLAQFRTVITLILDGEVRQFEGVVKGEILSARKGSGGFGYDPVFQPIGMNQSLAEISLEEKNKISHRGDAIRKLVAYLKSL